MNSLFLVPCRFCGYPVDTYRQIRCERCGHEHIVGPPPPKGWQQEFTTNPAPEPMAVEDVECEIIASRLHG